MLRTAGFPLITCPSVALAELALTGTLPPVAALVAVALIAATIGHHTSAPGTAAGRAAGVARPGGPGASGALRLTGQLAVAQLLGHAVVYLALGEPSRGCLPAMGRGAALGLRLAVLRTDNGCATGYATGSAASAAVAVLLVAAAVLLWQLVAAVAGSALLRTAERTWTAILALVAFVALVLAQVFEPLIVVPVTRRRGDGTSPLLPRRVVSGALVRRGPPAVATA